MPGTSESGMLIRPLVACGPAGGTKDMSPSFMHDKIAELEQRLAEQQRIERRVRARDGATRALVSSSSLDEAAPKLLHAVCEAMGWAFSAFWRVEPRWQVLRCISTWRN